MPSSLKEVLDSLPAPAARRLDAAARVASEQAVRCALVGGSVRDLLLGRGVDEVDLAVEGDVLRFGSRLAELVGGQLGALSRFATVKVLAPGGSPVDLSQARVERYPAPAALPVVRPARLEEDLPRRDFSVNALAIQLWPGGPGPLLDPLGGLADLQAKRLRVLHPRSFLDDPTRAFRAARFGARLRFRLEETTGRLLEEALQAGLVDRLTPARVGRELDLAAVELRLARVAGAFLSPPLLRAIHPALEPDPETAGVLARLDGHLGPPPGKAALRRREEEPGLDRLALLAGALLQRRSAAAVEATARRIGMLGARGRLLAGLARSAAPRGAALAAASRPSAIVAAAEGASPEDLALAEALHPDAWPSVEALRDLSRVRTLVTGADLATLGVPAGPQRRVLLARLRDAVLDGNVTSFEEQLAMARDLTGPEGRARLARPPGSGAED